MPETLIVVPEGCEQIFTASCDSLHIKYRKLGIAKRRPHQPDEFIVTFKFPLDMYKLGMAYMESRIVNFGHNSDLF